MKVLFFIFAYLGNTAAITIGCNFTNISFTVVERRYTCSITSMDFTGNTTHITGYTGTHLIGKSSEDVEMVNINQSICPQMNITVFPPGFSTIFPNVIGINSYSCQITTLTGNELLEYPNLEFFALFVGQIQRIPGNFFSATPKMRFVDFEQNQVKHVGLGLLDGLTNLTRVEMNGNICVNKIASTPSQITDLKEILRTNCTDIDNTTTTTEITSTTTISTTNQQPKCDIGDMEDFVCGLEEEIQYLKEKDENLQSQVDALNEQNSFLLNENEDIRAILIELERMIIELSSKPCAC